VGELERPAAEEADELERACLCQAARKGWRRQHLVDAVAKLSTLPSALGAAATIPNSTRDVYQLVIFAFRSKKSGTALPLFRPSAGPHRTNRARDDKIVDRKGPQSPSPQHSDTVFSI
jgi:hypothetical protein